MTRLKGDFLDAGVNMSLDNDEHVETVVLLFQQKPDDRIETEIELDELG